MSFSNNHVIRSPHSTSSCVIRSPAKIRTLKTRRSFYNSANRTASIRCPKFVKIFKPSPIKKNSTFFFWALIYFQFLSLLFPSTTDYTFNSVSRLEMKYEEFSDRGSLLPLMKLSSVLQHFYQTQR